MLIPGALMRCSLCVTEGPAANWGPTICQLKHTPPHHALWPALPHMIAPKGRAKSNLPWPSTIAPSKGRWAHPLSIHPSFSLYIWIGKFSRRAQKPGSERDAQASPTRPSLRHITSLLHNCKPRCCFNSLLIGGSQTCTKQLRQSLSRVFFPPSLWDSALIRLLAMARCQGTVESLCQGLLDLDDDKFGAMCSAFGYLQEWPDLSAMCGANLGVPAVAAAAAPSAGDGNDDSSCSGSGGGGSRKRRPDAYLDAKVRDSDMESWSHDGCCLAGARFSLLDCQSL